MVSMKFDGHIDVSIDTAWIHRVPSNGSIQFKKNPYEKNRPVSFE
jgi:hypothetical protein